MDSLREEERLQSSCLGKLQYPTEEAARATLAMLRKLHCLRRGETLEAYRCQFGDHWYLGN